MRRLFSLFFLLAVFSCDRESISEKEVNGQYKNIQRKWKFVSMETAGIGADSVRVEMISASVDWGGSKCKYQDEGSSYNYCGSDGDFNGQEMSYLFGYDGAVGKYMLLIHMANPITKEKQMLSNKLSILLNGKWEFMVTGETFTATQITNDRRPGVLTTLKAKAF